jgi:hypothetical protein
VLLFCEDGLGDGDVSEWQDISTAPKNGTWRLASRRNGTMSILIPEFGNVKFETDFGPDGYFLRAKQELSGRMREYEINEVIKALERAGYEVRKKERQEPAPGNLLSVFGGMGT